MRPRSLRTKTILTVAVVTGILLGFLVLNLVVSLAPSYRALDRRFAAHESRRVEQFFQLRLDQLRRSARDWAVWDAMAEWVRDRNPRFSKQNLDVSNLRNAGFRYLAIYDQKGDLIQAIRDTAVPAEIEQWGAREVQVWAARTDSVGSSGMAIQSGGIWELATEPIRSGSNQNEKSSGMLVVAAVVDSTNLGDGLLRFLPVGSDTGVMPHALVHSSPFPALHSTRNESFTIEVQRLVWASGRRTFFALCLGAVVFAMAFAFVLVKFIDKVILRRLKILKDDLEAIRAFPTRGARIRRLGDDELGQVAELVNTTFDSLEDSQRHLADAQRIARLGFWQLDLDTFTAHISAEHIETAGLEAAASELKLSFDEYLERFVHPEDRDRLRSWAEFAKSRGPEEVARDLEYRTVGTEGEVRHLSAACRKRSGEEKILFLVAQDVTDRRRMEEELLRGSLYDALTGLPNRSLILDRIRSVIDHGSRGPCVIMVLALDRFQAVNASLGRDVGDGLLLGVSVRLVGSLPPGTTVGRMTHDSFAILLENDDLAEISRVAELLRHVVRTPLPLGGRELVLTGSIGISVVLPGECSADELLSRSESAVFQASARGGDCVAYFDEERSRMAREKVDLEMELGKAIPDQLELHYQPIVHLEDGRLAGFEALLRWRHPERGLISPMVFIPIAERSGLIHPIGLWVTEEAMRLEASWQKEMGAAAPFMSINLSVKQFLHDDLADQIRLCLHKTGVDPKGIKLEITESALSEDPKHVTELLENLVATGIRFSLDDFGTGYSSLGYLSSFPVQTLKVDKSFVDQLGSDGKKTRITSAIVSLAHTLGMDVVAEGIETEAQWKHLRLLGCEYGQGYHFSKPLPLAQTQAYLKDAKILAK
jgi:diguanylate cyclase (GGDEF)-like protein/PAS domain S-box-containing protein